MRSNSDEKNSRIGLTISIVGAALTVGYWFLLYAKPNHVHPAIETFEAKAILAGLMPILLCCVGLLLLNIFHTPSVRRYVARATNMVFALSITCSGFAVFGWPQILEIQVNKENGINARFSIQDTASDVSAILVPFLISIVALCLVYALAAYLEKLDII